ncbi:MAG: hypothetical protein IPN07_03520 [Dehalococcoidia bacterium]|nr:hypothetical protein [Dehalococcoidia bacterium]
MGAEVLQGVLDDAYRSAVLDRLGDFGEVITALIAASINATEWDSGRGRRTTNEDDVFDHLEQFHGIDRNTASYRLHKIKDELDRTNPGSDPYFDYTGNVYSRQTGEKIGSLTDSGWY